jgi:hypothetical protein
MPTVSTGAGVPESRNALSEAEAAEAREHNDAAPVEYQPECGALGPRDAIDEEERDRDPREDL